jgi:hypothetical protein
VRFDMANSRHELLPGTDCTVKLEIPMAQLDIFADALNDDWRNQTAAASAAQVLASPQCGLGPLVHAATQRALRARGLALAVPESAVIDTGTRQFAYREARPGVYDAVEIKVGPRSGGFYPVIRGLKVGEKVVTIGSFLVDAETRLTSGAP